MLAVLRKSKNGVDGSKSKAVLEKCRDISFCQNKLAAERYHPLLDVRILAPGYSSSVVTAEGRRVGCRGVFPARLRGYIYLHESIDFCFEGIHTVHLTVYTVPSW